jgi:type I restriction enzyme S subunit
LVLEVKPPTPGKVGLVPELLPYVVHTDGFFQHAVGTSAGSLSPRTKFKDLATYRFALPVDPARSRITCASRLTPLSGRKCRENTPTMARRGFLII